MAAAATAARVVPAFINPLSSPSLATHLSTPRMAEFHSSPWQRDHNPLPVSDTPGSVSISLTFC